MGFTFSKHAIERYAERIQECSPTELAGFIALKSEEIKERITKMITYSELVYTGKSKNEYNKSIVDVYLHNDGWVVIVDHNTNNVLGFTFGPRKHNSLNNLLNILKPINISKVYADGNFAYKQHIKKAELIIGKKNTQKIGLCHKKV